jgi:hypothetical protein
LLIAASACQDIAGQRSEPPARSEESGERLCDKSHATTLTLVETSNKPLGWIRSLEVTGDCRFRFELQQASDYESRRGRLTREQAARLEREVGLDKLDAWQDYESAPCDDEHSTTIRGPIASAGCSCSCAGAPQGMLDAIRASRWWLEWAASHGTRGWDALFVSAEPLDLGQGTPAPPALPWELPYDIAAISGTYVDDPVVIEQLRKLGGHVTHGDRIYRLELSETSTTRDPQIDVAGRIRAVWVMPDPGARVALGTLEQLEAGWTPCYAERLDADPELRGTLELRLTMSTDARVEGVALKGGARRLQPILGCVREHAKQFEFLPPSPPGPRHLAVRLSLEPRLLRIGRKAQRADDPSRHRGPYPCASGEEGNPLCNSR